MQICKVCKESKHEEEFNSKRTDCKVCQREADRKRNEAKRGKTITYQKSSHNQPEPDTITHHNCKCIFSANEITTLHKMLSNANTITYHNTPEAKPEVAITNQNKSNRIKKTYNFNAKLIEQLGEYCIQNRLSHSDVLNYLLDKFFS